MKKRIFFAMITLSVGILAACGNAGNNSPQDGNDPGRPAAEHEHTEGDGHDHDHGSYYTCSEHTGVHRHEAGKCPMCGKDLVEQTDDHH